MPFGNEYWNGQIWWNSEAVLHEAVYLLCWPRQWGEGPATSEWLTLEQLQQLRTVPLGWLDQCDEEAERAVAANDR